MTRHDKTKKPEETREFDDSDVGPAIDENSETAEIPQAETSTLPAEPVFTESELNERIEAAVAEARDRHLRVVAEYENFRKRVQREREMWAAEAVERFVADLLVVADNFDRALQTGEAAAAKGGAILEGVRLTQKQLLGAMAKHGVEVVDPLAQKFDPRFHEAIQRVAAADRDPGTVTVVFEKGYTIKGRLVRPARVQVAGDA
jgi:molecular chaperone GrpE